MVFGADKARKWGKKTAGRHRRLAVLSDWATTGKDSRLNRFYAKVEAGIVQKNGEIWMVSDSPGRPPPPPKSHVWRR